MPPRPVDLRSWCDRLGFVGVREPCEITAGRSGSFVASMRTSSEEESVVVVKVTTAPDRLPHARREVAVLRHLSRHGVRLAPALLGAVSTTEGVAVALEAGTSLPVADQLPRKAWEDVAEAIAGVHLVAGADSLGLSARPGPTSPLPLVLEHGGCHLDNLVRDAAGRTLLVDWQESRLGDGLADFVFAWQRAEFVGAHPPREAMTAAYAATRGLDRSVLAPLLDRVELRLLREDWPPFLPLGDDTGRAALARRLAALTAADAPTLPT